MRAWDSARAPDPAVWDRARAVADAVLYEGYLLYPYRASSAKNAVRWQFGVLGPRGATPEVAEPAELHAEFLLRSEAAYPVLTMRLRFLQLRRRGVERACGAGFQAVEDLRVAPERYLAWDEAVPHELPFGPLPLDGRTIPVSVPDGNDIELIRDNAGAVAGRLVRRRRALSANLAVAVSDLGGGLYRVSLTVTNTQRLENAAGRDDAVALSFIGVNMLVGVGEGRFISLLDPPEEARRAAAACHNVRCWPVLAAPEDDLLLVSPIILYDHPEVAPESAGELYDATEIDEILTLRVMTMTDAEKAEARATDPRAAAIIDRCDGMRPEELQRLHGRLRDPRAGIDVDSASGGFGIAAADFDSPAIGFGGSAAIPSLSETGDAPWWDPGVDASVDPEHDVVFIEDVPVSRGSRVRVRPLRRADAQDMFFAGALATVAAVYADVDGNSHVAVALTDDPGADLYEWYGRYLYFSPDELEPLRGDEPKPTDARELDSAPADELDRAGREG